uniref:Uncharacterized protein n=1 Tax=Cyprinus carpio TaxID=7962 RepID=A0A8C2J639_CYPCA
MGIEGGSARCSFTPSHPQLLPARDSNLRPSGYKSKSLTIRPQLPLYNKYLQYRWDKNCYEMHMNKVKSAKPTINTTPPKTYNHLLVKLKKRHVGKLNYHQMSTFPPFDFLAQKKRQQDLLGMTEENECILQCWSTCRPYSVQVWHEQWLKNLELMDTIGRYPRLYTAHVSKSLLKCTVEETWEGREQENCKK